MGWNLFRIEGHRQSGTLRENRRGEAHWTATDYAQAPDVFGRPFQKLQRDPARAPGQRPTAAAVTVVVHHQFIAQLLRFNPGPRQPKRSQARRDFGNPVYASINGNERTATSTDTTTVCRLNLPDRCAASQGRRRCQSQRSAYAVKKRASFHALISLVEALQSPVASARFLGASHKNDRQGAGLTESVGALIVFGRQARRNEQRPIGA